MYLSKSTKILIGIYTLLPLFGLIYYFWWILSIFSSAALIEPMDIRAQEIEKGLIITLLSIILGLISLIFYIIHAVKNKKLDSNKRLMWILLFIFTTTISFIIYWILKIWNDDSEKPTEKPNQNFEI